MTKDPLFSGVLDEVRQMAQDREVQIMLLAEKYAMADYNTAISAAVRKAVERKVNSPTVETLIKLLTPLGKKLAIVSIDPDPRS